MARIIQEVSAMQRTAESIRNNGKTLGVVPTMGALHEGHLSLIRLARQHADQVVTTVFVNPVQFGPAEDFNRYPRDLVKDSALAMAAGADLIFAPQIADMYPPGYLSYVNVESLGEKLEGKSRSGHFRGVATVVTKLFHIVKPHVAVFGQKDAQQVAVIRRMVLDLNVDVRLIIGPIVRESDGLAMSSRNVYLTTEQRQEAPVLYRSLQLAEQRLRRGERECSRVIRDMTSLITSSSSGVVDYISIADNETLDEIANCLPPRSLLVSLAVRFGTTRLIDNISFSL